MFDKKLLQERFQKYAITIVKLAEELPDKSGYRTVKNQIIHGWPSSTANYSIKTSGRNHPKSLFMKSPNS